MLIVYKVHCIVQVNKRLTHALTDYLVASSGIEAWAKMKKHWGIGLSPVKKMEYETELVLPVEIETQVLKSYRSKVPG